jgi:rRNA-processing protein FCF1
MTLKRKLEQTLKSTQAEMEKENEHLVECLNTFSQQAESVVALELTAEKDTKEDEEHMDNICFVDLWDQLEALEEGIKVQGMHIQQVKLEMDGKDGMGDHDDLPNGQNFLQLRRLHEQDQPLEQLDEVIMEIMELMVESEDTASKEKLSRRKGVVVAAAQRKQQQIGAEGKLQRLVWDPGGFQQVQGKLMSGSS